MVLILFSQHEHRILTGQKPYFKRVLPLFSKPQLEFLRFKAQIVNWYSWQRELFTEVIRSFIVNNLASNFLDLNNLEAIVWSSKAYYGNSVNA
jgi:hypothetical protein